MTAQHASTKYTHWLGGCGTWLLTTLRCSSTWSVTLTGQTGTSGPKPATRMGQHIQWPHSRVQDRWGNSIARKKVFGLDAGYPRSNRSKTAQQSEAGQAGPSAQPEAEPFSKPKAKGAKLGPRQQIKAAAAAAANKDNSSATDNAMPGAKSQAAPKRPRVFKISKLEKCHQCRHCKNTKLKQGCLWIREQKALLAAQSTTFFDVLCKLRSLTTAYSNVR